MGEKKLYLYLNDTEYGKRFQRYLNINRHPKLRIEMVTERDDFWSGREHKVNENEYWLTDDIVRAADDRNDPASLIVIDDHTDENRNRVSCRMKAENMLIMILTIMALDLEATGEAGAPMRGIYGIYSPWGEEGSVLSALLSQRLSDYGKCLFINLQEFPLFYNNDTSEDSSLGEIFFRIDSPGLESIVERSKKKYGAAERLPAVSHYRDLWDINADDMERFLNRLAAELGYKYILVLFNDVREAIPMADLINGVFFVNRSGKTDPSVRWKKYATTEKREGRIIPVIMPRGWEDWINEMEKSEPECWLDDTEKKEFIDNIWNQGS